MESVNAHSFADLNAEVEVMNHSYLQLCKIAVTTQNYSTIESLGLNQEDIGFFKATSIEQLRKIAQQPRSLMSLSYTSGALRNAVAAGEGGPASRPLVQALIVCAEQKKNVRLQAL